MFFKQVRSSQPQSVVGINRAFPMPSDAWLHHVSPRGLVSGIGPSVDATYNHKVTPGGVGLNVTATGRRYTKKYFTGKSSYAWMAVVYRNTNAASDCTPIRRDGTFTPVQEFSGNLWAAFWPGGVLYTWYYVSSGISQFQGKVTVLTGRITPTSGDMWINGVRVTTSPGGSLTVALSDTVNPMCFGADESGGNVASNWTNLATAFWEDSIPTVGQMVGLGREPWQLFAPRDLPWLAPPSAAGATAYYAGAEAASAGWTSSTGGSLSSCIDELTADDADYIESPDLTTPITFAWAPASLPAGTYDLEFRGSMTASGGQTRIVLLDGVGGTALFTGAWQTNTGSFALFTESATISATSTHFRIEDQP